MPWQGTPITPTVCGYMPSPREAIAARLLRLREENGTNGKDLTQHDAASMVGVADRDWQRWEKAKHVPRPPTLAKIAEVFRIDLGEFYEGVGAANPQSRLAAIEDRLARIEETLGIEPMAPARETLDALDAAGAEAVQAAKDGPPGSSQEENGSSTATPLRGK